MIRRDPEAGVTLVEMLVSLVICALVGVAGFAMLDAIIRVNDRAEGDLTRLNALDRAFLVIGRDLIRTDPIAVELSAEGALTLRRDPVIVYMANGGTLTRSVGDPGVDQTVLNDIGALAWGALDVGGTAYSIWPPEGEAPTLIGVELTLTENEVGEVGRVFGLLDGIPQ